MDKQYLDSKFDTVIQEISKSLERYEEKQDKIFNDIKVKIDRTDANLNDLEKRIIKTESQIKLINRVYGIIIFVIFLMILWVSS